MKKIILGVLLFGLMSCGHKSTTENLDPVADRIPASYSGYTEIKQCGEMAFSETSRQALNDEDLMYTLTVDCNKDRRLTGADKNILVGFPRSHIKPQQKSWLTRWKKRAVREQRSAAAKPYVCVKFVAENDPCLAEKNVMGFKPTFTSNVAQTTKK